MKDLIKKPALMQENKKKLFWPQKQAAENNPRSRF
jgi:hypothetical protein